MTNADQAQAGDGNDRNHGQAAPTPIRSSFDALAASLAGIAAGRPILFLVNGGNWGDSLIREGAECFLRHYGFTYTAVKASRIEKNRMTLAQAKARTGHPDPLVVYNGNGAFTDHYRRVPFLAELSRQASTMVFLPSTYAVRPEDYDFGPDTHFFARDRFESMKNCPKATFCHDMAFFLTLSAPPPRDPVGLFMRTDRERPEDAPLPLGNVDISLKGRQSTPIRRFVNAIGRYETIYTNRLHVGICGALLGRKVHLFGNDYFKIRAIHDSSIAPYFPNVTYAERGEVPDMAPRPFWRRFF